MFVDLKCIVVAVVFLSTALGQGLKRNTLWLKNSTFDGMTTNDQATIVTTKSDCAMACTEQGTAAAFFYSQDSAACRCLTSVPLSSSGMGVDLSSVYFVAEGPRCTDGYTYVQSIQCCYQIFTRLLNYTDAVSKCSSEGARLLYINNERRHSYFMQLLDDNATYDYHRYFIDGSDVEQEDDWRHSDGSKMAYLKFEPGEPNHLYKASEDCLVIQHQRGFLMNDIPCEYEYRFICELN